MWIRTEDSIINTENIVEITKIDYYSLRNSEALKSEDIPYGISAVSINGKSEPLAYYSSEAERDKALDEIAYALKSSQKTDVFPVKGNFMYGDKQQ